MPLPILYTHHSIAEAFALIAQGEDPWFALGCFLHDWWCYAVDVREDLITEPPEVGETLEEKRWGAFCAATVEELCKRTGVPCPSWTSKPEYTLELPWWYFPQTSQREWLRTTTLEPFRRHNVFAGGNVLDNKYELSQKSDSKPRWTVWSDEELQRLTQSKENSNSSR